MHDIQKALLAVIEERGIKELPPLRKLAEMTGKKLSAQQVKHHLEQLKKKGFLSISEKTKRVEIIGDSLNGSQKSNFWTLPMYGAVNCGPALNIAEQRAEGYLKISSSILKGCNSKDLFVVQASGDSMNNAQVEGKTIEDGDFLVIDCSKKNIRGKGEIVLSIIDGAANLKRLYKETDSLVLTSDSKKNYLPIYIGEGDDFAINGTLVSVLKKPRIRGL